MKNILMATLLLVSMTAVAQAPKENEKTDEVIIVHARAHLGNGQVIDNALVAFSDGKITRVEQAPEDFKEAPGTTVINAEGKDLYPGLISAGSNIGLSEIDALRQTRDFDEVGVLTPNVRALIAYNAESEIIPTMRFNGVLAAQSTPSGNLMAGTSSIMHMDGWNWEDAVKKADDGIHVFWPRRMMSPRWWLGETVAKPNPAYDTSMKALNEYFQDVKTYTASTPNLKLQAGKGLFSGEKTLYVHVNDGREMMRSVNMAKDHGIARVVLVGATDAWYVKDFLKEHNIPILLSKTHRLPSRYNEDVDMPFKLPAMLHDFGLKVGLTYINELHSSRNLAFVAGTAAAYGLDKEVALQMVTQNVADILGVGAEMGSIEVGKDATMLISSGDLLDMRGNNVEMAFIMGKSVNPEGRQQQLYKRFKGKYEKEMPLPEPTITRSEEQ